MDIAGLNPPSLTEPSDDFGPSGVSTTAIDMPGDSPGSRRAVSAEGVNFTSPSQTLSRSGGTSLRLLVTYLPEPHDHSRSRGSTLARPGHSWKQYSTRWWLRTEFCRSREGCWDTGLESYRIGPFCSLRGSPGVQNIAQQGLMLVLSERDPHVMPTNASSPENSLAHSQERELYAFIYNDTFMFGRQVSQR